HHVCPECGQYDGKDVANS
ncbi:50S ribosomal protein L32, partial [Listeria innocua]|nr:50S ribosomal protein L32 [Listeria innocua]